MPKPHSKSKSSKPWHLYWVESDGLEDCFVAARNARSACSVEIHMNGFEPCEVHATRVIRISPNVERSHLKDNPGRKWPGYVYGKKFFEKLGAHFRTIDDKQEMLLEYVVYAVEEYVPCSITRKRTIGHKAVLELRSDPLLGGYKYHDEDIWDSGTVPLITGLGMCLATCQLIEHYIAHSFLLGISKEQKRKYETLDDLRRGWKRKTLGNMLRAIEEAWEIEPTVKEGFELFLANRNLLIHGITTDERYDIRTHWGREELVAFLSFFDIHARIIKTAFRASYFASINFGFSQWGRPTGISRRTFGRQHEKEGELFFHFFKPRENAI